MLDQKELYYVKRITYETVINCLLLNITKNVTRNTYSQGPTMQKEKIQICSGNKRYNYSIGLIYILPYFIHDISYKIIHIERRRSL